MGEKSELRQEIDILRAEKRAMQGELDFWRNRNPGVSAPGYTSPVAAPTAIVRGPSPNQINEEREAEHDMGGSALTTYLEPDDGFVEGNDKYSDARAAIAELRNPSGPPPAPEESLAEIVAKNNAERAGLQTDMKSANALISRVASALGVTGKWDREGTEILEKAQRFSTFAHYLRNRLKHLLSLDPDARDLRVATDERAEEIKLILASLVAPKELHKFIVERKVSNVPPMFAAAAEGKAVTIAPIEKRHLVWLRDAAAQLALDGDENLGAWLGVVLKSEIATKDLLELLNVVFFPTLVRAKIVTAHSPVQAEA